MAIPLLLQLALSGGEMIAGFFRAGVQSLISVPTSGGVCRCRLRNDGEATSDAYLDRVEPCDLGVVGMLDFDGEKGIRRGLRSSGPENWEIRSRAVKRFFLADFETTFLSHRSVHSTCH
jgi:hypothetical protein